MKRYSQNRMEEMRQNSKIPEIGPMSQKNEGDHPDSHIENQINPAGENVCESSPNDPVLMLHQGTHIEENSYICNTCGKDVPSYLHFIQHLETHSEKGARKCPENKDCFEQSCGLLVYQGDKAWEKRYTCTECGKSFGHVSNLHKHQRLHTGEKPYTCEVCERSFSQNSHLIKHKRVHTGEKPYECNHCGKRFSNNSNCLKHQRIHSRVKLVKVVNFRD